MVALESQLACLPGRAARQRCIELGLPAGSRRDCQKYLLAHFRERPREVVRLRARTISLALYRRVLWILDHLPWDKLPKPSASQRSVAGESISLGRTCCSWGVSHDIIKKKYDPITRAHMQVLWDTLHEIADGFSFTTAHINRNFCGAPHVDRNNVGLSMAFALGEYTGGELVVETDNPRVLACHDTHRRPVIFDGHRPHWVLPYHGTRYSIILYTRKDGKSPTPDTPPPSDGEGGATEC